MSVRIEFSVGASAKQGGDFALVLACEEYLGPKRLRATQIHEVVSGPDAERILTDLRDLADRALQRHFPARRPQGKHERTADV